MYYVPLPKLSDTQSFLWLGCRHVSQLGAACAARAHHHFNRGPQRASQRRAIDAKRRSQVLCFTEAELPRCPYLSLHILNLVLSVKLSTFNPERDTQFLVLIAVRPRHLSLVLFFFLKVSCLLTYTIRLLSSCRYFCTGTRKRLQCIFWTRAISTTRMGQLLSAP